MSSPCWLDSQAPEQIGHGQGHGHGHGHGLILRFQRAATDPVRVAGDFKLSVCNLERCLIEVARLAIDIP